MGCKFQFSSKSAPKKELRPALARVVQVVSNVLPPTLNLTLSLWIPIIRLWENPAGELKRAKKAEKNCSERRRGTAIEKGQKIEKKQGISGEKMHDIPRNVGENHGMKVHNLNTTDYN